MTDQTRERERELLGCALADPTVLDDATAEREHFASPPFGNLWALLRRLRVEGEADLSAWLSDVVGAISANPRDYPPVSDVMELRSAAPSVELWKYADDEVRRLSSARELRSMFADLAVAAKRYDAAPDDLIARAREELEAVAAPAHKADASEELQRWHISAVLSRLYDRDKPTPVAPLPGVEIGPIAVGVRDGAELRAPALGDRAAWPKLARILGSWSADTVAVLVGSTGRGKSSLAVQIAEHAAIKGAPVLYASMEMSAEELACRLLALRGGGRASWAAVKQGAYPVEAVTKAGEELSAVAPWLYLWAPSSEDRNVGALQRMARAVSAVAGGKPPLVVLDYVQRLAAPAGGGSAIDDRRGAVADLSGKLRDLSRPGGMGAAWPGAAVLALSSTARASYATFSSVAGLAVASELDGSGKESGELEYDAPVLLCMTSDKPADGDPEPDAGRLALVRVVKNREGSGGRSVMRFQAARGRFVETDDPIPAAKQEPSPKPQAASRPKPRADL